MPRRNFGLFLALPCLFLLDVTRLIPHVVLAQGEATPPLVLSLQAALERAQTAGPLVRRLAAEKGVVAAREVGASILLPANPVLSLGAGPRAEDNGGARASGVQYAVRAEQMLEVAGQRATRRQVVTAALAVENARAALGRNEIRARVRSAYVAADLAKELRVSAGLRQAMAEQVYQSAKARLEAGASSDIDLRLAEIERGRVERERLEAELSLGEALADLALLIGVPPSQEIVLTDGLDQPSAPFPTLMAALTAARAQRADLKILQASRAQIDAEVLQWRAEALPNPTLFLEFQRDLPGQTYWGAGVSLPLPVARRNQGQLSISSAQGSLVDTETATTERAIASDVSRALGRAKTRRAQATVVAQTVLPAALAHSALIMEGWRAGKFDVFRVIQAAREAWEARRSQLETLGNAWQADIELGRVMGES